MRGQVLEHENKRNSIALGAARVSVENQETMEESQCIRQAASGHDTPSVRDAIEAAMVHEADAAMEKS